MATKEFKLPDVGEGVAEGELVSWLVEPGDPVSEDQPVAEVETDKALVEVPSPYDGTVDDLLVEEGEVVPVGTVIITFEVEGEDEEPTDVAEEPTETAGEPPQEAVETPSGRVFAPPSVRRLARELGVDVAAVEGSGPGGRVTDADVRAAVEAETVEGEHAGSETPEPEEVEPGRPAGTDEAAEPVERERTLATPATRRIASEEGVDIDAIPTTETRNDEAFVTTEAVREYAAAQRAATAQAPAERVEVEAVSAEATATGDAAATGPTAGERVPYRGVRRTIGEHMVRSKSTVPHVTHHDEVDVTELVELRGELKDVAAEESVKLTYMPFVMKAVVAALKAFPLVNSTLDEENEEILLHEEYNLGVATATDAGLMVPVVDDVDRKGLLELASEVAEKAQSARDRTITRPEMTGGTFSITNVGAIGGEYATPVVNYPEVAILALGAIKQKPRVVDGEVVPRHVLTLSLSFDHRVVDGAVGAQFTNEVERYLNNPALLLLE
ncbi:MAG: 2-oxo acid dehydrogenase subunit E2 [Halobacteriota archaeon]